MTDRFTRGFVAGISSSIVPLSFNNLVFFLNLSTTRWGDFMGTFLFGSRPDRLGEYMLSLVALIMFLGILGGIFSLITPVISSQNFWFKGFVYGIIIWFLSFATTVLFRVPGLTERPLLTVLMNFIGAAIWGFLFAFILRWLYRRVSV